MHLERTLPNRYGGFNVNSLCRRSTVMEDGMNLTSAAKEVTCKLCLRAIKQSAAVTPARKP